MSSMGLESGVPHIIDRKDIFSTVLQLFDSENIVREYPMHISFKGEIAVDTGGVFREMVLGSRIHKMLRWRHTSSPSRTSRL